MMRNLTRNATIGAALTVAACSLASVLVHGQAREWTTSGFDAQRTRWVRSDLRLTKAAIEEGEFRFLWKASFDNEARQLHSLTQPVLQDLLIGYRGFKTLAFVGGSADRIFSIDTDLAKPVLDRTPDLRGGHGRCAPEHVGLPGRAARHAEPPDPADAVDVWPPCGPARGPGVQRRR